MTKLEKFEKAIESNLSIEQGDGFNQGYVFGKLVSRTLLAMKVADVAQFNEGYEAGFKVEAAAKEARLQ